MIHVLFGRSHDGKIEVLATGDPDANDMFKDIANAGRENADYSEISLLEINLYDGRKRMNFLKPRSAEQRKADEAVNERARQARLLDEAREIQRNNDFVNKQLDTTRKRLRELTDDHKAALAAATVGPSAGADTLGLLDKLTIPDLKQLAEEEGIDLTGEDRKAQIIARIRVFRQLNTDNTVDQLKDIAKTESVDLTGLTLKNDIVNAIAAERRSKATASA